MILKYLLKIFNPFVKGLKINIQYS